MKRLFPFFLAAIVVGAFIVRIVSVDTIPPGVNRDEASIGYTAYSLLKTGKDEYGMSWPLSFKSFGDWKLPLYIYVTIPSVAVFGLNEFAVRFPSVLFGTATVLLTFFLVKELFGFSTIYDLRSTISALLLAISPWHIHFSRVGAEANLAVFFTTLGLVLFFASRTRPWLLIISSLSFAATLYTYHGNHIFTPLFVLALVVVYWRTVSKNRFFGVSITLGILLALGIFGQTLTRADTTKFSGIHLLSNSSFVHEYVDKMRIHHGLSSISSVLHNKVVLGINAFVTSYVRAYAPDFLYFLGGGNKAHNIPNFGNAYLLELPFLLLGIALLIAKKSKEHTLLLVWFFLSALAPSITRDAPHSARMLAVLPAMPIIVAYGYVETKNRVRSNPVHIMTILLLIFSVITYLDAYFIHFPVIASRDWGLGYKKVYEYLVQKQGTYDNVIFTRPQDSPYIFLLFYGKYDPATFQREAKRYPDTPEGFSHVKQIGNMSFRTVAYSPDVLTPRTLLVEWTMDVPAPLFGKKKIDNIPGLDGEPHFSIVSGEEKL